MLATWHSRPEAWAVAGHLQDSGEDQQHANRDQDEPEPRGLVPRGLASAMDRRGSSGFGP
jgi:hypothetical protein